MNLHIMFPQYLQEHNINTLLVFKDWTVNTISKKCIKYGYVYTYMCSWLYLKIGFYLASAMSTLDIIKL